jgi:hypothetical protein
VASRAERRPGEKFCAGGRDGKQRSRGGSEEEEEGEVQGLVWNI